MKTHLYRLLRGTQRTLSGKGFGKVPFLPQLYKKISEWIKPSGVIRVGAQNHRFFVNARDTGVVPDLIAYGAYEPFETDIFKNLLHPGMSVVNVGANFGYYTVIASHLVGPTGRVCAIEPAPENFDLLEKNITENHCTNVSAIWAAMSDRPGTIRLFLDQQNLGTPSLSSKNVDNGDGSIDVPAETLDNVVLQNFGNHHVDLIQMDTQGAEDLVLSGATEILKNKSLAIMMEFWPYGLENMGADPIRTLSRLVDLGFSIHIVDEKSQTLYEAPSPKDIVQQCKSIKGGRGVANMLLRRFEQ